jgi:hypothetical protein
MSATLQGTTFTTPTLATPIAHVSPPPRIDAGPVINAHEANLAEYLNKPVNDILARFGISPPPPATPPPAPASAGPQAALADLGTPAASSAAPSTPFDPTQLIQPVTDALSMLGSGQFGDLDPTKMFGNISQALESGGQSVQQALSAMTGSWQGDAATAAATTTNDTLARGAEVSTQANDLRTSLTTVTASVRQAEMRLIEIVNQFLATLAAIGPNIIFPWGMAAAIEAATRAVNMSVEVITETQTELAGEAAKTTATGQPVSALAMTPEATLRSGVTAATPATSGLAQSFSPLLQMATGLSSPVMEGVSAVTEAIPHGAQTSPPGVPTNGAPPEGDPTVTPGGALAGGGSGVAALKPRIGNSGTPVQPSVAASNESPTSAPNSTRPQSAPGLGGAPMMGAGPLGLAARSGARSGHSAASFLHTSDQGGEIVGDLGNVAPPVIGELATRQDQDIELRI